MAGKKDTRALFRAEAETAALLKAVGRVATVTERRNTIPILSCVEIAVGFGTIAVRGTDLDLEARAEIEGQGQGAIALPAHRVRDLLKAVAHVERVSFAENDEGVVTMTAGEVTATLNALPAIDFPNMALGTKVWTANLAEGVFQFLVGGVAHAISTDACRYYLNGVSLEVSDGHLIAVATDGHRLARRESRLTAAIADQAGIILPRKAAGYLIGICRDGEATMSAHRTSNGERVGLMEATAGGVRLRAKLIDGAFPDYRRVIPTDGGSVIVADTKLLRRALKASKANSDKRGRATKIAPHEAGLCISSHNPDSGTMRAQMPCEARGDFTEFGVNTIYLDELVCSLERVGSKTVRLHFTGPGSPLRFVPDEAITGVTNVLMPMRI